MTTVRQIHPGDRDAWLPLLHGYNDFYRNEPAEEVAEATFRHLYDAIGHTTSFVVCER